MTITKEEESRSNMSKDSSKKRSYTLDFLAATFGVSSWIAVSSLWVELPVLVPALPEGWALASQLSVIITLANVAPTIYSVLLRNHLSYPTVIYSILAAGTLACSLLIPFWSGTLWGHSVALLTLCFFLSCVDCTSSVTFAPYMSQFKEKYLNSYLIGEGLSGFAPALIALMQGVGGNPECVERTLQNGTVVSEPAYDEPRFSAEVYFGIITPMMLSSGVAFFLMNSLRTYDSEKVTNNNVEKPLPIVNNNNNDDDDDKTLFYTLMSLNAFLCFTFYGVLPSIVTYSCLPYGNLVYHLSVTLHTLVAPLTAFAAFFVRCRSLGGVVGLTVLSLFFAGFILAGAVKSPGVIAGAEVGGALTVFSWVVYGILANYVRVTIAGWIQEQRSAEGLFWCGVWTQVGSAVGSVLAFVLVNFTWVFQEYTVECGNSGNNSTTIVGELF